MYVCMCEYVCVVCIYMYFCACVHSPCQCMQLSVEVKLDLQSWCVGCIGT